MRECPHHYEFAHEAVPQIVMRRPEWLFDCLTLDELRDALGFAYGLVCQHCGDAPFAFEEVGVEERTVGGRKAVLITMPTPQEMCEAHFACAVLLAPLGDGTPRVAYYTLEHGQHGDGTPYAVVCAWRKDGSHRNFGLHIEPEADAFLAVVEQLAARDDGDEGGDDDWLWDIPAFVRK